MVTVEDRLTTHDEMPENLATERKQTCTSRRLGLRKKLDEMNLANYGTETDEHLDNHRTSSQKGSVKM